MSIVSISSSSCSSSCLRSRIHSRRHGSKLPLSRLLLGSQSSPFPNINLKERSCYVTICRDLAIYSGEPLGPSLPAPPDPSSAPWKFWIVGILISAILPFWKNKWWPLLTLKQNVDKVVDAVEDVAEIVETVAEEVEKVAEEVAEHLPEGGKLQKAAQFVENVARRAAKDADLAGDFIDKVEEVEGEVVTFFKEQADQENKERSEEEAKEREDQNLKETSATDTKKEAILEQAGQESGKLKEESKENGDQKAKETTNQTREEAEKAKGDQISKENIQTRQ